MQKEYAIKLYSTMDDSTYYILGKKSVLLRNKSRVHFYWKNRLLMTFCDVHNCKIVESDGSLLDELSYHVLHAITDRI